MQRDIIDCSTDWVRFLVSEHVVKIRYSRVIRDRGVGERGVE